MYYNQKYKRFKIFMYSKELCNNINKLTRALGETNLNIFLRAIVHGVWVKE